MGVGGGVHLSWEAALARILVDLYVCSKFKFVLLFLSLSNEDSVCATSVGSLRLILGADQAIAQHHYCDALLAV